MAQPNYIPPTKWETAMRMGTLGAGLGGLLGQGFGQQSLMEAANPYLQQIQPAIDKYMNPYINAGNNSLNTLQGQYQNLINDPNALLRKFGAGFQESPGYKYQVAEATRAAQNAANAEGYAGGPQHQFDVARNISGLANQGYNDYLNHILGLYGQGLGGMGNINQIGFGASQGAMNTLSNMLNEQASLAFADAANKQSSTGGMFAGLGGALGTAAPYMESLLPLLAL